MQCLHKVVYGTESVLFQVIKERSVLYLIVQAEVGSQLIDGYIVFPYNRLAGIDCGL